MDIKLIKAGLKEYPGNQVINYCAYLQKLLTEKKKKGGEWVIKNPWMQKRTDDFLIRMFKVVASTGLVFDGESVTLQSTGVSYDYQAFKNKMYLTYPESIIDVGLVHKDDTFKFSKKSGKVEYMHDITDPFQNTEANLIGGYCVIKNKRGEFLTLLSKADIDKHRSVAKTDYIWREWFHEMALKTLIKKSCRQHFRDIYSTIETLDNENYDLTGDKKHITEEQVIVINDMIKSSGADTKKLLKWVGADSIETIKAVDYQRLLLNLRKKQNG